MQSLRTAAAIVVAGIVIVVILERSTAVRPIAPAVMRSPTALPSPTLRGEVSLEEALVTRRSVREFSARSLSAAEIGQLLWAAQGVTSADGRRTAPSAGGTYPLELLACTADGAFRYLPVDHALVAAGRADIHVELAHAAANQSFVAGAPLVVVIPAVPARTEARYGSRAERYIALEAGHAAQNLLLEAVALRLAGVPVGAFDDKRVADLVGLRGDERPLYLLAIGAPH